MTILQWPERFEVSIEPTAGTGPAATDSVITWLHVEKAIAIAVASYLDRYPQAQIYDVSVRSLGPAPRSGDGTMALDGSDLMDRAEW